MLFPSEERIKKNHKECSPARMMGVLVESGIGTAEEKVTTFSMKPLYYREGDCCDNNQEGYCILFLNREPALPSMANMIKRMA